MKLQKLPEFVRKSFETGYIKNRLKLVSTRMHGRHKMFTYEVIKGMGKGRTFQSNLNLL